MSIKKSHLFMLILFVLVAVMVVFYFPSDAFAYGGNSGTGLDGGTAEQYSQDNENILLKVLGAAFAFIARAIYALIGDASIDSLVYNQGGQFGGLTLFKPGSAQDFLAKFYNIFNMIAIAFFIPIVYWSVMAFTRAGDSPQGKSILKERLMKIVMTFAFLYTMPELLTILVRLSNALVDIFAVNIASPVGDYISDSLSGSIQFGEGSTFVDGLTALMLIGINLWMIFFYIVRDLTIAFLFMFFPIIAIWFPLSQGMVLNWWKNMASNVLAQPIQAVVLSLVLTMTDFMNVAGMGFLGGLYMIIAFGSIIPMTGIIKGFLGLEGGVGAASSRAGIGGMVAAMTMMRMAGRSVGTNKNMIKEGLEEKSRLSTADKAMDKNLDQEGIEGTSGSSVSDMNRPLTNPTMGKVSSKHELMNQKREANKKIARGVGSLATGAFTGMTAAAIGGGLGGRSAMVAGLAGYGVGSVVGGFANEGISDMVSGQKIQAQDEMELNRLQLESVKEMGGEYAKMKEPQLREVLDNNPEIAAQTELMAKDKLLGIHNPNLTNTTQQTELRNAMMKQRSINNAGTSMAHRHLARNAYVNNAPTFKSDKEIMDLANDGTQVNLYQDKDISYLYTTNNEGQMEVLKRGAGVEGLTQAIDNPVTFDNNLNTGMAGDFALKYQMQANEQANAYMQQTYPDLSDSDEQYQTLRQEKAKEILAMHKHSYNDTVKAARQNIGIPNLNIQTNQAKVAEINLARQARERAELEKKYQQMEEEWKSTTYATDPIYDDYNYDSVDNLFR